ncbi:AEC family transporter [Candidatus Methylobacter oryzae]|uniref:AEC family transporter n=1 Tax=Candidatus Methylobacter oryzae TaxID=2497749 RepID=A0ABY3C8I1_9GAMM|nr:AEC family transporter [Candidatus Methylobacter oryzae]TRW92118.1 AEC family transporter [Candidatus Methylobacter oryzae]
MNSTLIQMTLLMASGAVWRFTKPAGLPAEQARLVLTSVVYYLLLPAMVLEVLWTADIGLHSFQYTLLGVSSIALAMFCLWIVGALFKFEDRRMGAMILAAAFPNVTYLGLPVLEQTFGSWARSVAIQMDLFAATPLLFTLGVVVARHYGEESVEKPRSLWLFFNAPPFWAAAVAVILNINGLVAPVWLIGVLQKLSAGVVPLMLFSLGLALSWQAVTARNVPYVIPVILIKMALMPLFAMILVGYLSIGSEYRAAAVLDLSMPSMLLGIVFCDRYRLDSSLYAMAVTVTTAISLIALPFWHNILMNLN